MSFIKLKYILSLIMLLSITASIDAQLYLPISEYKAPKYKSVIHLKSGIDLKGTLLKADSDKIILAGFYYADETYRVFNKLDTLAIKDIYGITIKDRLSGLRGAWSGFKLGAIYGLTQGLLLFIGANGYNNNYELLLFAGLYIIAPAIIASPFGALLNPLISDRNIGGKYPFDTYEINKLMRYTYFNPKKKKRIWN